MVTLRFPECIPLKAGLPRTTLSWRGREMAETTNMKHAVEALCDMLSLFIFYTHAGCDKKDPCWEGWACYLCHTWISNVKWVMNGLRSLYAMLWVPLSRNMGA